ncbi:hypothetical protein [Dietzia cercidiphylli]|uniref:hypothetical protein n=1 Tax=Dietzia cercidiphylli TaxID=498199 RepID=UPI00223C07CE|nr:hypothetical protein [Dietzia cercidiphylli]MCT1515294.1 hypothetical protein [Dietzia cercidiphylli]
MSELTSRQVSGCEVSGCDRTAVRRGMCHRHYEQHRLRMKMYGRWESKFVPADAAREHYRALLAAGMHRNQIARVTGIGTGQLHHLLHPRQDRGAKPASRILRENHDKLLAIAVPCPHQRWRHAADGTPVDCTGTSRRLQALVALGHPQSYLAAQLGVQASNLANPVHGRTQVSARFARRVSELFDELQLTPGSSTRAVARARQLGWVPPLAWDEEEIDNPAACPSSAAADGGEAAHVDPVAVDRGVAFARLWTASSQADRRTMTRPALIRAEKLAVVGKLREEMPLGVVCRAVGVSDRQLPRDLVAAQSADLRGEAA